VCYVDRMLSVEENAFLTANRRRDADGRLRPPFLAAVSARGRTRADGPPLRVKLLGERLVAFARPTARSDSSMSFVRIAVRRCSSGRNEEDGLRCVYHGWKFDRAGTCTDMPSEPPDSLFKTKVTIAAYEVREKPACCGPISGRPERR